MGNTKRYFHTFDALRFFSFLLVFFHHVPYSDASVVSYFSKSGAVGVIFFFVLSGFLITYILLIEKSNFGKISLRKFFMRRVLRIWPLFYAMLLFAFLTPYILDAVNIPYSNEGYQPNWLMSLLFLENYQMMLTDSFPNVSPLRVMWSLCIEEHFYIIWSIAIAFLPTKRVPHLIVFSIVLANVCRLFYGFYGIRSLDIFTNIDYFAFGAIPAYIMLYKAEILKKNRSLSITYKIHFSLFYACFDIFNSEFGKHFYKLYRTIIIWLVVFNGYYFYTLRKKSHSY